LGSSSSVNPFRSRWLLVATLALCIGCEGSKPPAPPPAPVAPVAPALAPEPEDPIFPEAPPPPPAQPGYGYGPGWGHRGNKHYRKQGLGRLFFSS